MHWCARGFIYQDIGVFKDNLIHDNTILAKVMASNCQAALYFEDRQAAEEILAALQVNESVANARVLTAQRDIFVNYRSAQGTLQVSDMPPVAAGTEPIFTSEALHLFEPILLDDQVIGTFYLQIELGRYYAHLQKDVLFGLGVILFSALLALFLASLFEKVVSVPILHLLETARAVTRGEGNYGIRAQKFSNDELGHLTDGINSMLAEIENRDRELLSYQHELEKKVDERTTRLRSLNQQLTEAKERAEETAREKSDLLSHLNHILESATNAIWYLDLQGRVVRANKVAQLTAGRTEEELVGKTIFEVFPSYNSRLKHQQTLEVIQSGQAIRNIIESVESSSGEEFWVATDKVPFINDQGEISGVLIFAYDITERIRLENELRASERQIRLITDNLPAYIAYVGADDLRYRFVNKRFEDNYNMSNEEIVGRHIKDIIGENNYHFAPAYYRKSQIRTTGFVRKCFPYRPRRLLDSGKLRS